MDPTNNALVMISIRWNLENKVWKQTKETTYIESPQSGTYAFVPIDCMQWDPWAQSTHLTLQPWTEWHQLFALAVEEPTDPTHEML